MKLDLHEIIEVPGGKVPFEYILPADNLGFDSVTEYISGPHAAGRVINRAGVLELEGSVDAELRCICDRCGAEYVLPKHTDLFAVISEDADEEDPDLFPLHGDEIDLDEIISTLFVLNMDMKFLCSESCKGLCSRCGKNLNYGPCECRKEPDPRFAVLEQLLDKLEQ